MSQLLVYPEGVEGRVRIADVALANAFFVDDNMNGFRRPVDEKREREGRDDDEEAENNVSKDNRRQSYSGRDDPHGPKPVRGPFFVLIFMRCPLNMKRILSHVNILT